MKSTAIFNSILFIILVIVTIWVRKTYPVFLLLIICDIIFICIAISQCLKLLKLDKEIDKIKKEREDLEYDLDDIYN